MRRRWSVKRSSPDDTSSTVGRPHLRPVAWWLCRFGAPNHGQPVRTVVHHDEEMRRWGRPDFIDYPTDEDRRAADAMHGRIIPVVAPGESVTIAIPDSGEQHA